MEAVTRAAAGEGEDDGAGGGGNGMVAMGHKGLCRRVGWGGEGRRVMRWRVREPEFARRIVVV